VSTVCQSRNMSSVCILMSEAALFNAVAVHSDNSFEVYVDQNLVNSGSLLEDMRSLSVLFASTSMLYHTWCMILDL